MLVHVIAIQVNYKPNIPDPYPIFMQHATRGPNLARQRNRLGTPTINEIKFYFKVNVLMYVKAKFA